MLFGDQQVLSGTSGCLDFNHYEIDNRTERNLTWNSAHSYISTCTRRNCMSRRTIDFSVTRLASVARNSDGMYSYSESIGQYHLSL